MKSASRKGVCVGVSASPQWIGTLTVHGLVADCVDGENYARCRYRDVIVVTLIAFRLAHVSPDGGLKFHAVAPFDQSVGQSIGGSQFEL